jgi:hypothetical protein
MPQKKEMEGKCCEHGMHKIFLGLMFLLAGLVMYLGYGWDVLFMAVGVVLILKGLMKKMM